MAAGFDELLEVVGVFGIVAVEFPITDAVFKSEVVDGQKEVHII